MGALQRSEHCMGHKSLQFHQHVPFHWQQGNGLVNSFSCQELKPWPIKTFISLIVWVGWTFNYKEENNHNDLSGFANSLSVLMTSRGWNNLLGSPALAVYYSIFISVSYIQIAIWEWFQETGMKKYLCSGHWPHVNETNYKVYCSSWTKLHPVWLHWLSMLICWKSINVSIF